MRRSLVKRQRVGTIIIIVLLAGIVVYLIVKNKGAAAQYSNLEKWEIKRDAQGFATEIIVHRQAREN